MPSIKDQSTVEVVAREFTSNGRDKAQAMRTIGYAESSCRSGKAVKDVYGNLRVIAAIKAIDDKNVVDMQITRDLQLTRLNTLLDMAIKQENVSAGKACIAEQNEMLGYHRDKAPNTEREQARLERMTQEERKLAELAAEIRTREESKESGQPKIALVRGTG